MQSIYYQGAASSFTSQENQIARLQSEISSGKSVQTAADNPAAYVGAAQDASSVTTLSSIDGSQTNIQATLEQGTSSLSQASTALDKIQSIALQAINGTTSGLNYAALGQQVQSGLQQLLGIANTQDGNGNYLFSGTAQSTQPFTQNASGAVTYVGNSGVSGVEISPGVSVNAALSGTVFTNGLDGNGYASVNAAASNAGDATVLATGVSQEGSAAAFQTGSKPITLSFTASSSTGKLTYQARSGGTTIASGPVASSGKSSTLDIKGMEFKLTGTPATSDTFTIAPARHQSIFALAGQIQSALQSPGSTPAQRAQTRQILGNALGGITQYQNRIASVSAKAGVVLKSITNAGTANALASTQAQTDANNKTAANAPAVITALEQHTSALQAAMKAFSVAQGLSLFQYL